MQAKMDDQIIRISATIFECYAFL